MEPIKKTVICDTNIWYHIAKNEISTQELSDKNLIGTFISAYEFSTASNLLKDFVLLKASVLTYINNVSEVIMETPLEHLKKVSGYDFAFADGEFAFKNLELISRASEVKNPDLIKNTLDQFSNDSKARIEPIIELKKKVQNSINHRGHYKRAMKDNREYHLEITKINILNMVEGQPLDWEAIELFLFTLDEWFFQMSVDPSLKITSNDLNDIFNLAYVQPGSYYWTRDKRKTKEFIKRCNMGHYLID